MLIKPRFKHRGFSDEREFRIYFEEGQAETMASLFSSKSSSPEFSDTVKTISKRINEFIEETGLISSNKKFGTFSNGIRSYYPLSLESVWSKLLIPEIIIGPKCYQNKNELKSFLNANGLQGTKLKCQIYR